MSDAVSTEAVCRACRLVQAAGGRCAACGAGALVSTARLEELMVTRRSLALAAGPRPTGLRDAIAILWTFFFMAAGMVPGVLLGLPGLSTLGVIAGAVFGFATQHVLVRPRERRFIAAVRPPALPPHPAIAGVARTLGAPVRAAIAGREALAVSTTVAAARDGRLYFRRTAATPLWLEWDGGEPVLVTGEVWVDPPATAAPSALTRRTSGEMLALVGIPGSLGIEEPLVIDEWAIYPGQRVEAAGELRREPIAGDGYRERLGPVLRGAPGAPIRLRAL